MPLMRAGMPDREPIVNSVASTNQRLESVGEVLKRLGNPQINPAYRKQEHESKAPEADHAVQVPDQALPSHAAMQCQVAAPCLDARPPDHQTRGSKRE
jgi:hypothetical protein